MDGPLSVCGIGWMVTARVVVNSSVAVWRQWYFLRSLQVQLVRFKLFVADLDSAVECTFSKFVGDINFYDVVNTVKIRGAIQRDRDKLQRWVYENIAKINKTMCKDVHIGQSNAMHKCKLTREGQCPPSF